MRSTFLQKETTALDRLLAITTAACHDVGHVGRDNLFHIRTMSPLAIRYNDSSVLENMHAAETFDIMQRNDKRCDWLSLLVDDMSKDQADRRYRNRIQQYVRKAMIRMILGTDMAKHETFMQKLADFVLAELQPEGDSDGEVKEEALEHKFFLLEAVVHTADLSGPTKPNPIMLAMTNRILSEFWDQGDAEHELGLEISPLCNKAKGVLTVPGSQLFFSTRIVRPLFLQVGDLVPETKAWIEQLEENIKFWEERSAENATYDQLFPSGRASISTR